MMHKNKDKSKLLISYIAAICAGTLSLGVFIPRCVERSASIRIFEAKAAQIKDSSAVPTETDAARTVIDTTHDTEQYREEAQTPDNRPVLVFVFDDGGQNIEQVKAYLELPFPLTIAVLPRLPHSVECAALVRSSPEKELMLHQPMQALNEDANPGPGAITPDMSASDIFGIMKDNIENIGTVAGVNNHEGSRIMENREQVLSVLDFVSKNGLFFLDSRTTSLTQAPSVSFDLGMEIYSRDIFLDNEETEEEVISELEKGLKIACEKGQCIMIGHVWSADLIPPILDRVYPELVKKGYRFSTVSQCHIQEKTKRGLL